MKDLRYHDVLPFSVDSRRSIRQQRFPIWAPLAAGARAAVGSVGAAALALLLAAGLPFAANAQQTFCANPAGGYEGFGRNTTGGVTTGALGEPVVYRVNDLRDYDLGIPGTKPIPGTLRWALEEGTPQGNRCVVFDVAGTIELLPSTRPAPCQPGPSGLILVKGPNVTIDGFTAPSPGITLKNWGFDLHWPARGVRNVIVRGIRIRDTVPGVTDPECAGADGFQIVGVQNFVIDHVSIDDWADGSLDITEASSDGTIQWSIIGKGKPRPLDPNTAPSMLLDSTRRISVHHNAYVGASDRNPLASWQYDPGVPDDNDAVVDIRNNLVWGYTWTGTSVRDRGRANVINNYYYSQASSTADGALYIRDNVNNLAVAYASGNYSPTTELDIDAMARPGVPKPCGYECGRATPFPAEPIATTGAVTAAHQILAKAGARGSNFDLDGTDLNYISSISQSPSLTPLPGVVLLALHENGSDGSTTFADASDFRHTLTPADLAQWDTAQAPPGLTSSGLFDGNADQIKAASNTSFEFGDGDFTVEFFLRLNAINNAAIMFDMRTGVPGEVAMNIYHSGGVLAYQVGNGVVPITDPGALVEHTWYHIAVARANGVTRMFKNGTQVGDIYPDGNNYPQGPILIGNRYTGANLAVNGWMAGVRVTKGVARYTGNFTPPTLPYSP